MCGTPGKTFADPIFMEHPDCLRLRFGQIDLLYSKQEMLLLDTHVFLYYRNSYYR